jgi:hypothetical protein
MLVYKLYCFSNSVIIIRSFLLQYCHKYLPKSIVQPWLEGTMLKLILYQILFLPTQFLHALLSEHLPSLVYRQRLKCAIQRTLCLLKWITIETLEKRVLVFNGAFTLCDTSVVLPPFFVLQR